MLLACGHDMCRSCIKFMYKKNKQVICELCRADSMYETFLILFNAKLFL